jgi:hypothetical protein
VGGVEWLGQATVVHGFTCAHCHALYHVVKVEAGPETTEAEVTCRACGAPLPGREGTADISVEISNVATPIPLTGQKRDGHWMDTVQVLKR